MVAKYSTCHKYIHLYFNYGRFALVRDFLYYILAVLLPDETLSIVCAPDINRLTKFVPGRPP